MTERDAAIAAAALALLAAKRATAGSLRTLLLSLKRDVLAQDASAAVFDAAGIHPGEVNASYSTARRRIEEGIAAGISPLTLASPTYPWALKMISDAPPLLFLRGNIAVLDRVPGVAVVGTRKATLHGITIAERIAAFLGDAGFPVVSGLALGIDAAAHEGALRTATPTIAVLAQGLEKVYPRANAHLADRILDHGGLWVSEHAHGTPAKPEFFVHRNRIQVGLSCASIIVEGEERSGSSTQAEFCIRNRRTLFAVLPAPGGPVTTAYRLPQMLVSDRGAFPIRSKDDYGTILEAAKRRCAEMKAEAGAPD